MFLFRTVSFKLGLTNVPIVGPGMMVTMDYRTDRVRVHVDQQGKVASPPTVG